MRIADLNQVGQQFSDEPYELFLKYCDRCDPIIPELERQTIWQSAQKSFKQPALPLKYLENCVKSYFWRQIKNEKSNSVNSDNLETQSEKKPTIAQLLLEIAETATYFHTPDRKAYADVFIDGIRKTYQVRQNTFKQWLQYELYNRHQKTATSEALNQVLRIIEAKANFEGEQREIYLRVAEYDNKIYLDLGSEDWKALVD